MLKKLLKKFFLTLSALTIVVATVPLFAAFEAYVINVTATIDNALSVDVSAIDFGTVFPQEEIDTSITLSLSDSFLSEDRVDDVEYVIRQKPKCGFPIPDTDPVQYSDYAQVGEDEEGNFVCPEGYVMLPLLCPYLSKQDADPEDGNDESISAFHGAPIEQWNLQTTIDTQVTGRLAKSDNDTTDRWKIDLKTPCFEGRCDQMWEDYVLSINPDANPSDYVQPVENLRQQFGCDLWFEVSLISLTPVGGPETYCGDGVIQTPNDAGMGGPADDGNEECDNGEQNGVSCSTGYGETCQYCSDSCVLIEVAGPFCGDGIKNGDEECDGTDGVGNNQSCDPFTCTLIDLT